MRVGVRAPEPDHFQNLMGTSFSEVIFCGKIFMKVPLVSLFSSDMTKVEKCPRSVDKFFRRFVYPNSETNDFQNLISFFLFIDSNIFAKIRSVVLT